MVACSAQGILGISVMRLLLAGLALACSCASAIDIGFTRASAGARLRLHLRLSLPLTLGVGRDRALQLPHPGPQRLWAKASVSLSSLGEDGNDCVVATPWWRGGLSTSRALQHAGIGRSCTPQTRSPASSRTPRYGAKSHSAMIAAECVVCVFVRACAPVLPRAPYPAHRLPACSQQPAMAARARQLFPCRAAVFERICCSDSAAAAPCLPRS